MHKTQFRIFILLAALLFSSAAFAINPDKDWWLAIRNDDASLVQQYLLAGVDPNALNAIGNPALIQSAREQSWEVFDLIDNYHQTKIDLANVNGETALMYLAILGQLDRAKKLIAQGAKVNRLGWTPLHYAASRAQIEMAKMLIKQGAIINAPGPDGTTPLMMAALSGSEDMVRLLMQNGADATMINLKHETAADWARKNKSESLAALLDDVAHRVEQKRLGIDINSEEKVKPVTESKQTSNNGTAKYFDLNRFE